MMPLKAAQWNMDGITGALRQLGGNASQLMSNAGNSIADYYRNMDPTKRQDIMRALMGAGAGATALGLSHVLGTRDPEDRSTWGSKALMGALLGGTAAYALPKGMQLLRGQAKLPNEQDVGVAETGLNAGLSGLAKHPGAVAGGAIGGLKAYKHYAPWLPTKANLFKQINAAKGNRAADAVNLTRGWRTAPNQTIQDIINGLSKQQIREGMTTMSGPGGFRYAGLRTPLRAFKDPRARLLAAILGSAGLGYGVQKGLQGAV